MKINHVFIIFFFLFLSLEFLAQKKTVQFTLQFTQPYCGGARPTDEMLAEFEKPKSYSNRTVILVSEKGKVDSVRTNNSGVLKKKLNLGKYQVMEAWRFYKISPNGAPVEHFDKACLKQEWERSAAEIIVTKKSSEIKLKNEIINYCEWAFPCLLESHMPALPQ